MRRIFLFYLILGLSFLPAGKSVSAQTYYSGSLAIEDVKEEFLLKLRNFSADSVIVYPLSGQLEKEFDVIHTWIRKKSKLSNDEKQKSVRSLVFFIKEMERHLELRQMAIYDIPEAVNVYKSVLQAIAGGKPVSPALAFSSPLQGQLVASAFSQFEEHRLLEDIAIYKRMAATPDYILPFLENKPGFRFSDSLLFKAAVYNPQKIVYYLVGNKQVVADPMRNPGNRYLQQVKLLSNDKHASELLPFINELSQNKLSTTEILETRKVASDYYQLLVNTLQQSVRENREEEFFTAPLRKGLKDKALAFYVNQVNDLHDEKEAVRFASVENLRPQDLYYLIVSCGDELYTSSYLGLYKRLMGHYNTGAADSLFDIIYYDRFREFIRLAANYNVLPDLLQRLSPERKALLLNKYINGIEKEESTATGKAMDIADAFPALAMDSATAEYVQSQLSTNLSRCRNSHHYLGIRLYDILNNVFEMVRAKNGLKELWETLGDYEVLKQKSLEDKNGNITQLILFYGDDDGILSFGNFLKQFADRNKWQTEKTNNWVSFTAVTNPRIRIFANRPLDMKDEADRRAQDSLVVYLKENKLEASILVHRGHSYHMDKTMERLTPNVKLAILGSCGGYNRAISIAGINPDVQVIGSKKTGSGAINDPLIEEINTALLNQNDINWAEIWNKLSRRFGNDRAARALFSEYFPPADNLGLFVLKLFKHYSRPGI